MDLPPHRLLGTQPLIRPRWSEILCKLMLFPQRSHKRKKERTEEGREKGKRERDKEDRHSNHDDIFLKAVDPVGSQLCGGHC